MNMETNVKYNAYICDNFHKFSLTNDNHFNTLIKYCIFVPNLFSTNVPFMDKPGSWFLLAKCLKNSCGRVTF